MKAIVLLDSIKRKKIFEIVYSEKTLKKLKGYYDDIRVFYFDTIISSNQRFPNVECIFSTWNMPKMTEKQIEYIFPKLKYIFYAAGDTKYFENPFKQKNVTIFNAREVNSQVVANYVSGMILSSPQKILYGLSKYNQTVNVFAFFKTRKNLDSTIQLVNKIGIIGAGSIGTKVINQLANFDYHILYYDPFVTIDAEKYRNIRKVSLKILLKEANVISNHLPDTIDTRNFYNYEIFSQMKDDVIFINTGRGQQVNEQDLYKFMRKNKKAIALLDVTKREPYIPFAKFKRIQNIYLTPHIAGCMGAEKSKLGDHVLKVFDKVIRKKD